MGVKGRMKGRVGRGQDGRNDTRMKERREGKADQPHLVVTNSVEKNSSSSSPSEARLQ